MSMDIERKFDRGFRRMPSITIDGTSTATFELRDGKIVRKKDELSAAAPKDPDASGAPPAACSHHDSTTRDVDSRADGGV